MSDAMPRSPIRRALLLAAAGALASTPVRAAPARVLTILGDSVTAGLGLAAADALPARLQAALAARGAAWTVRGSGVSGDTTADGLARLDFSVRPDTAACLVALGGNDLLQGGDPGAVRANLTAIARLLRGRGILVVIAGVLAPARIGADYARAFDAAFPAAARASGAGLYPDLFAGVGRDPRLLQADGVHPNAQGVRIIADHLATVLAPRLRAAGGRRP